MGGSHAQVSRPVMTETGAPHGRPAHGHHKTQAKKKRLAEVAPCAVNLNRATKPDRCFAAMGRDYAPNGVGASERDFLGSVLGLKAKRRTKWLIFAVPRGLNFFVGASLLAIF